MLKVESVFGFSECPDVKENDTPRVALNARRGGLVHGTKVATSGGWIEVEKIRPGDRVRTLSNGFKEVCRVSTDCITVPSDETKVEHLPIRVPSQVAYAGRPVWLMPEQGLALDNANLGNRFSGSLPVVPARVLSGMFRMTSDTPASLFDVSSLFFDQDEVIYIEGGFRAYCPSGRFGTRGVSGAAPYNVVEAEAAAEMVNLAARHDVSALVSSLGALPAPIMEHPIIPVRPVLGARRPGRPGRPVAMI